MNDPISALVLLAHRLGLGWLVGRRFAVITTTGPDKHINHSVARFTWRNGEIVAPITDPGAQWVTDLAERPVAMLQAAPGPLSSLAERRADGGHGEIAFRPTGQPAPYPVESDLIWLLPVIALALLVVRALR